MQMISTHAIDARFVVHNLSPPPCLYKEQGTVSPSASVRQDTVWWMALINEQWYIGAETCVRKDV